MSGLHEGTKWAHSLLVYVFMRLGVCEESVQVYDIIYTFTTSAKGGWHSWAKMAHRRTHSLFLPSFLNSFLRLQVRGDGSPVGSVGHEEYHHHLRPQKRAVGWVPDKCRALLHNLLLLQKQ